jgi:pimeloyl-ACP methyl ester carboxylesterase
MWVDGPSRGTGEVNSEIRKLVREMQTAIFSQPDIENVEERELIPPAVDRLHELEIPTLVVVGEEDVTEFQEISSLIAGSIKNAKKVVIPGAAHLLNMEKPEEFDRIVLDFLALH